MNWTDASKVNATVSPQTPVVDGETAFHRRHSAWDPFEVWLTRVKQPRDRAANVGPVSTSNGSAERGD